MHRFCSLLLAALIGLFAFLPACDAQDSLQVCRCDQIHHPGWSYYGWDVALHNGHAYLASWGHGAGIVNVTNPDSIFDLIQVYPPC